MNNDLPQLPAMDDIQGLLRFELEEGRIWLAEQRMVPLRSSELQALRRELIESLGMFKHTQTTLYFSHFRYLGYSLLRGMISG